MFQLSILFGIIGSVRIMSKLLLTLAQSCFNLQLLFRSSFSLSISFRHNSSCPIKILFYSLSASFSWRICDNSHFPYFLLIRESRRFLHFLYPSTGSKPRSSLSPCLEIIFKLMRKSPIVKTSYSSTFVS